MIKKPTIFLPSVSGWALRESLGWTCGGLSGIFGESRPAGLDPMSWLYCCLHVSPKEDSAVFTPALDKEKLGLSFVNSGADVK